MGLSDSYKNRKRDQANEKAGNFLKSQGCILAFVLLIGLSGSIILVATNIIN